MERASAVGSVAELLARGENPSAAWTMGRILAAVGKRPPFSRGRRRAAARAHERRPSATRASTTTCWTSRSRASRSRPPSGSVKAGWRRRAAGSRSGRSPKRSAGSRAYGATQALKYRARLLALLGSQPTLTLIPGGSAGALADRPGGRSSWPHRSSICASFGSTSPTPLGAGVAPAARELQPGPGRAVRPLLARERRAAGVGVAQHDGGAGRRRRTRATWPTACSTTQWSRRTTRPGGTRRVRRPRLRRLEPGDRDANVALVRGAMWAAAAVDEPWVDAILLDIGLHFGTSGRMRDERLANSAAAALRSRAGSTRSARWGG